MHFAHSKRIAFAALSGLSLTFLYACGGSYDSSSGYGSSGPSYAYDSGSYNYGDYDSGRRDGASFGEDAGSASTSDAAASANDAAPPPPPPPPPTAHWQSLASMPTSRDGLAAIFGTDGRLYAIGGYGEGGVTGVVEAYTPATNSWTTVAPLPTPRHGLMAVLGHDGLIYAIGAYNDGFGAAQSAVVEVYSSATNTWSAGPSLVKGRYHASAAVAANGRIYVMGGESGEKVYATVESYLPGDSAWVLESTVMTNARYGFGAGLGGDGQLHAFGGTNEFGDQLATNESATPGSGWNTRTDLPFARMFFATTAFRGRIYALGGEQLLANAIEAPLRSVTIFDPASNSWSPGEDMPSVRFLHAAATGPDGMIYVVGGVGTGRALDAFTP
ncbi:MAG: kelch repeat-containing protein [Polyangiaceae bacterium]